MIFKDDWFIFTKSYLLLASDGCLELKKDIENINKNKILIISILFNFKHSIELILKTISLKLYSDYLHIHDVLWLLDNLNKKIKNNDYLKIKWFLDYVNFTTNEGYDTKIYINIEDIKSIIKRIKKIVCDYYYLNIINPFLLEKNIEDKNNTLFKYPEYWKYINYKKLVKEIDVEMVNNIFEDIDYILMHLHMFFIMMELYNTYINKQFNH